AYYVTALQVYGNPDDVARRGQEAGAALGADPLASLRAIAERVFPLLAATSDDAQVGTLVGGMRLRDYLPTRVFELVVHTLDLAAALAGEVAPPADALALCLELSVSLAQRRGNGPAVLMALNGRRPLPAGFSLM